MEKVSEFVVNLLKELLELIPNKHREIVFQGIVVVLMLITLLDVIIPDALPFLDEIALMALTGMIYKNKDKILEEPNVII